LFAILIFASRQKIFKRQKSVNTYEAVDIGVHLFLASAVGKKVEYSAPHQSAFVPRKRAHVKIGWEDVWATGQGWTKQRGK